MEKTYAVTFQQGAFVGSRRFSTVYVDALGEDEAVVKARKGEGEGPRVGKAAKVADVREW